MLMRAGTSPAPQSIRPNHEGRAKDQPTVEERIRYAHQLLASWQLSVSPSRVTRLCRDYHQTGAKIPFEHYLLNNADLGELQRVGLRNAFGVLDPTGATAVANVERERRGGPR